MASTGRPGAPLDSRCRGLVFGWCLHVDPFPSECSSELGGVVPAVQGEAKGGRDQRLESGQGTEGHVEPGTVF